MENKKQLLTKWKKEPSFDDLYSDYEEADVARQIALDKILEYRETMDGGKELNSNLKKIGKSTLRPLVCRKQAEWAYPIMEEPFLSTENMFMIQPMGPDDKEKAEENSMVLNWMFNTKLNKTQFVSEMVRTLYDDGTVIVKDGWTAEYGISEVEEEVPVYASPEESYQMIVSMVESGQMDEAQAQQMIDSGSPMQTGTKIVSKQVEKLIESKATLEVVDNTNIIIDPTCNGKIENAQFIIHEYETDYASLKNQEYVFEIEDGKKANEAGIYRNLDKINFEDIDEDPYDENDSEEKRSFQFKDKARKKVKAYDYWGYWDIHGDGQLVSIVATWVDKVLVRLEENPYAHQELPFSVARYMPRRGEFWGESDNELLREHQETIGVFTRAIMNQTMSNSLGQKVTSENLFRTPSQKALFKKGLDADSTPGVPIASSMWKQKMEPIDNSAMQMLQYYQSDAESLSGQKTFNNGVSGRAFGDSVGGIRSATDAITKRKLSVLRRISDELLTRVARHVLQNAHEFLDDEVIVKLTDGEFTKILRQDLQMDFDLRININTPEKEDDISNKIAFMLQTTMQSMPFAFTKTMLKKWANINKIPDVERDIDEAEEPQPSEAQMKMEQIQMQAAELDLQNKQIKNQTMRMEQEKMKAEIAKLNAEAERTQAHTYEAAARIDQKQGDEAKKLADAELKGAQARKIHSETDRIDADFVYAVSGKKDRDKAYDDQFKHEATMEKEVKKMQYDAMKTDYLNKASTNPSTNQNQNIGEI